MSASHEADDDGSDLAEPAGKGPRALGSQLLVELFGCDRGVLDDVDRISSYMLEAAIAAKATVVHHKFHRFSPQGVSGVVVIAESHLAIHTWPEHGYAAIDLFTCGATLEPERCFAALKERLHFERMAVVKVPRGMLSAVHPPAPASPKASVQPYTPLHPELFRYDDSFVARFLHPSVARPDRATVRQVVREVAEQVFHFDLFTPELCRLLVEECEHRGRWVTVLEKTIEAHGALDGVDDLIEPDTTLSWSELPGLPAVYEQVIRRHVQPVVETLWRTFKLAKWDVPAVRKYEPHVVRGMDLHYDAETVGMIGYLSDDFEGGGTHFPRWNLTVGRAGDVRVGSVVVYPGGVSHEHLAWPITAGKRYTLASSLY